MMTSRTSELRGRVLENEPLARHTSWRVGGPAQRAYIPADLADLQQFLAGLPTSEPVTWIGLGSNLLVRDGGIKGTVILTSGALNGLARVGNAGVRAEAGVASAKLARFAGQHDLAGAEFLAGIPGTVGGALAMNAGAFGGETWNIVGAVETIDRAGNISTLAASEFAVGYRSVQPQPWFVAGHFHLRAGVGADSKAIVKGLLAKRGATQPTQLPNAGSVFRNPANDFAARLIETAGLKGFCIGKACVSELHANFIVNTGGARSADIEALIYELQVRVRAAHGVELHPEVRIVGEPA